MLLLSAQTAISAEWSVLQVESSIEAVANISEARWVSERPPQGRYDTIQLHRYLGEGSPTAALLYLPGTNMNGQIAVREENHNLWLFLAHRGGVGYTLDYRTHSVPATTIADAGFMKAWTMGAFVDDARAAVELILENENGLALFVAPVSWFSTAPSRVTVGASNTTTRRPWPPLLKVATGQVTSLLESAGRRAIV